MEKDSGSKNAGLLHPKPRERGINEQENINQTLIHYFDPVKPSKPVPVPKVVIRKPPVRSPKKRRDPDKGHSGLGVYSWRIKSIRGVFTCPCGNQIPIEREGTIKCGCGREFEGAYTITSALRSIRVLKK